MDLYLDNCCYNRIADDRRVIRNYLERESVLVILELLYRKQSDLRLISSDAILYEVRKTKDTYRREIVSTLISRFADVFVTLNDALSDRASAIRATTKIRLLDSLHLALAEKHADVFITTDRSLQKMANNAMVNVRVLNPIEFVQEALQNDTDN